MSSEIKIAEMQKDITHIKSSVDEIKESIRDMKKNYVRQEEFKPIKSIVYGGTSMILVGFMGAIIGFFLTR